MPLPPPFPIIGLLRPSDVVRVPERAYETLCRGDDVCMLRSATGTRNLGMESSATTVPLVHV